MKGEIMGLLDNYTGIGMSPRPKWAHQAIIARCIRYASEELETQRLQILSESTVTDDWNDLAPDLVIFNELCEPLSIIEITTHKELSAIIRRCHELIARFPESEYFVYDYEQCVLYEYIPEEGMWISSSDYEISSRYLERPLMEYLS